MNTHTRRENCPAETSRVWLQCGRHIFTGAYYKLIVWLMDLYLLAASVISAPNLRRHLTHSPARWRCELCTNCAYRLIFWNLQTIHSCRSSSSSSVITRSDITDKWLFLSREDERRRPLSIGTLSCRSILGGQASSTGRQKNPGTCGAVRQSSS